MIAVIGLQQSAFSQENSPYSRYGIGDLTPNQNIVSRAMGGISAAFIDSSFLLSTRSLNFINPASYSSLSTYNLANTVFELGSEFDSRTLKNLNPAKKYNNNNLLFSYMQIGFPIAGKKMEKKRSTMGMVIGFRPVSRINYSIEKRERTAIDSLYTLYEGNGGATQAYIGTGLKIKNFSIGINAGYMFGNKNYNTRLQFINDTITYYKSNSATNTSFGGLFANAGIQYVIQLKSKAVLRLGAYGSLQQNLKASQDIIRETFTYDPNSTDKFRIDSVYEKNNVKGTLKYPSTFGGGFTYQGNEGHWLVGADYESTQWSSYRFYDQADFVQNSWTARIGAQYTPAFFITSKVKKYFSLVTYRAGFYYSPGYIKLSTALPEYAASVGAGFPLTSKKLLQFGGEFATLNTSLEIGARGNKNNSVRESITRFSIGISMNAKWFIKRKYD
jgi:hypothetical protein